jgi:formylglycine-generating enzyme required for sulfatase activity
MKLGYVIGPFTTATSWRIAENVRNAERTGYLIALQGAMPIIPHANTHLFHDLCTPGFWYEGTMELLKRCDFAVTVELAGVSEQELLASSGAIREMAWVRGAGRPLFRDLAGLKAYLQDSFLQSAAPLPTGTLRTLELAPGVVTRLHWIPPGQFLMGSPESEVRRSENGGLQHRVTLTKSFWLADAPCTQAEWLAVMGTEPSNFKGPDLPVEQVSWGDCQTFCERLRVRWPGLEARLPTEAEWEYACRAGTESAFNDGSACTELEGADPALLKLGWFNENSENITHPVREKGKNVWGLFDMHGNVWEWCADWFGAYAAGEQTDPGGPDTGYGRVFRGGSWYDRAKWCQSASRSGGQPDSRSRDLGFRLAVDFKEDPK